MFADYSLSINDRLRILNIINDGAIEKYVEEIKEIDQTAEQSVIFIKVNVNKFPGPYHVSVRTANWMRNAIYKLHKILSICLTK
jgi:hypothetical protein